MAVLGLRHTDNFAADERPKNWREGILRLYPNGSAALTAFLALVEAEATDDPEFNWWEKELPTRQVTANGGETAGATSITVDDGAGGNPGLLFREGDILLVVRTKEHVRVSADQSSGTSIPVTRAFGETSAQVINDNDEIRLIGHAKAEGADIGSALNFDPTKKFNYTQIFRRPLSLTRTAKKTRLRSEDSYRKAKIDALEAVSIDMDDAFLFGERNEDTAIASNGEPIRTTRGLIPWIEQDAPSNDNTASGSTLDEAELLTYLEPIFRFGSTEKLALCGSTALNVLTQIAKDGSQLNSDNGSEIVFGIRLRRFLTAFGDLLLKQHPLFNRFDDLRKTILIIDLANVKYRFVDDLMFLRDRQSPGEDRRVDEFLAEAGLEVHHAKTHGIIRDVASKGA